MKTIFLTLILLLLPALSGAEVPLQTWKSDTKCALDEYIAYFNEKNPETKLFMEDVSKLAGASSTKAPLAQIDHDDASAHYASKVAHCMVEPSRLKPNRLEEALKEAFERYFNDRSSRRAIWLLFQEIDATYLTDAQRTEALQKRESYWVNLVDGAYYGTFATSLVLWIARRGKPTALAIPTPVTASTITNGMRESGKLYNQLTRSMKFKEWGKSLVSFTAAATSTSVAVGTPLYYARKYGILSTHDEKSVTQVERNYHRLHWLELDCRARKLTSELKDRKYENGSEDPQFQSDVRRVNTMINDLNFLIDVSQLYYVENDLHPDIKWDDKNISFGDISVHCATGFSKPNLSQVVVNDVYASVTTAGVEFLKIYAPFMSKPIEAKLAAFLQTHQGHLTKAFEAADPKLKAFFGKISEEMPEALSARPEKILELVSNYQGVRTRLQGRPEFLVNWMKFLAQVPAETRAALQSLTKDMITLLPSALLNQLILDQLANNQASPGNFLIMFQLGYMFEDAVEKKVIPDTKAFILPHEFMFNIHGPLTGGAK